MLLDAVDSAANAFRYTNSHAIAFQCPCDLDDIHTATLNKAGSNLICTLTEEISLGGLTAAGLGLTLLQVKMTVLNLHTPTYTS